MTYDFVIVGAGSAGCALAARLTEDPATRVLLLEAGPSDRKLEIKIPAAFAKLFKSAYDWNYTTEPQENLLGRELYWPRGKTLGGSSSINAQIYTRGHRADYDAWGAKGNDGWHYADVLPYFQRLENDQRQGAGTRGSRGPLQVSHLRDPNPLSRVFLAGCEEVGIEHMADDGWDSEGVSLSAVTQKSGRRWSAADAYLRPARKRPNLTIMTGAHAFRILFEGRRAVGVEYARNEQKESARVRREVILAAGATNSPQLLMLSGVGPAGPEHLRPWREAGAPDPARPRLSAVRGRRHRAARGRDLGPRDRRVRARTGRDALPSGRYLSDGDRRRSRGRRASPRPRDRRPAGRGRVGDAVDRPGTHTRADGHDRREGRRPDPTLESEDMAPRIEAS